MSMISLNELSNIGIGNQLFHDPDWVSNIYTHVLTGNFFKSTPHTDFIFYRNDPKTDGLWTSLGFYSTDERGMLVSIPAVQSAPALGGLPLGANAVDFNYYKVWGHILSGNFVEKTDYRSVLFYDGQSGDIHVYESLGNTEFRLNRTFLAADHRALLDPYGRPWQNMISSYFGRQGPGGEILCHSNAVSNGSRYEAAFQWLSIVDTDNPRVNALEIKTISTPTIISAGNFIGQTSAEFLTYSRLDGSASFFEFKRKDYSRDKYEVSQFNEVKPGGWNKTWDKIISANFNDKSRYSDLIFYDKDSGNAGFYGNRGDGKFDFLSSAEPLGANLDILTVVVCAGKLCLLTFKN